MLSGVVGNVDSNEDVVRGTDSEATNGATPEKSCDAPPSEEDNTVVSKPPAKPPTPEFQNLFSSPPVSVRF